MLVKLARFQTSVYSKLQFSQIPANHSVLIHLQRLFQYSECRVVVLEYLCLFLHIISSTLNERVNANIHGRLQATYCTLACPQLMTTFLK